jgi:hypothetical protein
VAWDGTGLDAADTPANAREFGVTQGGSPQLRLLALIECGTHALIDAVFDGVTRASEQRLARRLLHALEAGMLLLADRNFPGYQLWGMVAATGADLLWRIKGNQVFMVVKSAGQERVVNDQLTGPHGRRPQSASDSPSAQAGPAGWPRQ